MYILSPVLLYFKSRIFLRTPNLKIVENQCASVCIEKINEITQSNILSNHLKIDPNSFPYRSIEI